MKVFKLCEDKTVWFQNLGTNARLTAWMKTFVSCRISFLDVIHEYWLNVGDKRGKKQPGGGNQNRNKGAYCHGKIWKQVCTKYD